MEAREYPVAEGEWHQPARVRLEVVARRLAPMIAIGLVVWLVWWRLGSRRSK
jgi:hypothetical protein